MDEEDASLAPVFEGSAFENVDEIHQGTGQAEDGIATVVIGIVEEKLSDGAFG